MNSMGENLFTAFDRLMDVRVSQLRFDKTIPTEIYSIVDVDTGEYKVKYSGNTFSDFSQDTTKSYKVGDSVYVNVPEGDFTNKKIITGLIKSKSLSYTELNQLNSSVIDASPDFSVLYDNEYDSSTEVGVIAGVPYGEPNSEAIIFQSTDESPHELFAQYAAQYDLIQINASFLTRFHNEHSKGNYGIEVSFFTKNGDTVSYRLDITQFLGDPYAYTVYSPQSAIIQVQKNYLTGVNYIKLFEENFEYDRYVVNGVVTDRQNTTVPNIFAQDIELAFVDQADLLNGMYYLNISAPSGKILTSRVTSVDLVGQLIYQGQNILTENSATCHWFVRDLSIQVGSEEYNKDAGVGWREIDTNNFNVLTVGISDVPYKQEYKLIVVYRESTTISQTIEVQNIIGGYNISLIQETSGEELQLRISNSTFVGDWYIEYPDGSYEQLDSLKNSIFITRYLTYSAVTFYCAVYDTTQTTVICNLSHIVTNSESANDVTLTYTGDDTFRYDANGDVTIEDAEKERNLQVSLAWRDGVGTSYTVEWIGPDGQNITGTPYDPAQSMIRQLWVDSNNILHYNISQKFRVNNSNNIITVRIVTLDGTTYSFPKEIVFLKDGDQGTNGTTYMIAIRPYDISIGARLAGLQPIMMQGSNWVSDINLKCWVYKDGEVIQDGADYEIEYDWNAYNVTLTNGATEDVKHISGDARSIQAGPYVTVTVSIDDNTNGRRTNINSYYPIDVAIDYTTDDINKIDISTIPSYIKYTSTGLNPQFYSNNIQFIYDGSDHSENITSLNTNLLQIETRNDGLRYLKPASSFIFQENQIPVVQCLWNQGRILHPIVMYLDTYSHEIINGWDGTKLEIDNDGQYILAPQIGAGIKNSDNTFTGVVMGQNSSSDTTLNNKTGIFGYQSGVSTFGLLDDGTAFFGSKNGGGQISVNGNTATIEGGGGGDTTNGMTITLANLGEDGTTKAIQISNDQFYVNYDGYLYAHNANIAGVINADTGTIGGHEGWTIETNRIHSTRQVNSGYIELNTDTDSDYAFWIGHQVADQAKFYVKKDGTLYAKDAQISGNLTVGDGAQIAGWYIKDNGFYSAENENTAQIYLSPSNGIRINNSSGTTVFQATPSGTVTVSGTIYAGGGRIGGSASNSNGWYITTNRIYSGSGTDYVGLSSSISDTYAIWAGNSLASSAPFRVQRNGKVTMTSLTATGANITGTITATTLTCNNGTIGGWSIGEDGISSGQTTFHSNGRIESKNVEISGQLNVTDGGSIGGWSVTGKNLTCEDTVLDGGTGLLKATYFDILAIAGGTNRDRIGRVGAFISDQNSVGIMAGYDDTRGNWTTQSFVQCDGTDVYIRAGNVGTGSVYLNDWRLAVIQNFNGTGYNVVCGYKN